LSLDDARVSQHRHPHGSRALRRIWACDVPRQGGIWAKYDYREVATPEGFRANPNRVHDFYNQRRRGLQGAAPNAAHVALARLEREHKHEPDGSVTVITQNIDHLHEAAGSRTLIHMHGELLKALRAQCGAPTPLGPTTLASPHAAPVAARPAPCARMSSGSAR